MTIHTVVGGQFGSEAKGHVAAQLTQRLSDRHGPVMSVRVGGSNAGHTAIDAHGTAWALRPIPVAAVVDPNADLVIARGSEIDLDVLLSEIRQLEAAGFNISDRLWIDISATIITSEHIAQETGSDINQRTGSTAKGIGAARAARIMRTAPTVDDAYELLDELAILTDTTRTIALADRQQRNIVVEGTQGYGLGLHTEFYPQTTSGDCATVDLLAQIGYVPLNMLYARAVHAWVVFRTYPIRVAGNSGPLRGETDWETLAARTAGYIQPERTTVTKKIRRVGAWDGVLAEQAIRANGGSGPHMLACLMFCDYIDPRIVGETDWETVRWANSDRFKRDISPLPDAIDEMTDDISQEFDAFGTSPSTMAFNHRALDMVLDGWMDRSSQ